MQARMKKVSEGEEKPFTPSFKYLSSAGISEQSMWARNREEIGLLFRNRFIEIDSGAPSKFKNTISKVCCRKGVGQAE